MSNDRFSPLEAALDAFESRERPEMTLAEATVADKSWYHGTGASFDQFRRHGIGIHFGSLSQASNAPRGRSRIIHAALDIHNPLAMPDLYSWESFDIAQCLQQWFDANLEDFFRALDHSLDGDDPALFQRLIETIEGLGYDGIVYRNTMEGSGVSVIAFHPHQIRILGDGTKSDFDPHQLP